MLDNINFIFNFAFMSGLYIHIPYCSRKCLYCDFYSGGVRRADWEGLTRALLREFEMRKGEAGDLTTIYIGGGTPSLMPPAVLERLIGGISGMADTSHVSEFTIEVNPEQVTEWMCRAWRSCGINRVSMGIQSFDASELSAIGRGHSPGDAEAAFGTLRRYFDNISIDLMFGLPGQTMKSWEGTVERALELSPEHISAYALMLEEGTAMSVLAAKGSVRLPPDEDTPAMWEMLSGRLQAAGYRQYEISNYARPGRESVHNSSYWTGVPYLGLGPSAHSYDGGRIRRANPADIRGYIQSLSAGRTVYGEEVLTDAELAEEFVMLGMRTSGGLDVDRYGVLFGPDARKRLESNARPFVLNGTAERVGDTLRLTKHGIMTADSVIVRLIR